MTAETTPASGADAAPEPAEPVSDQPARYGVPATADEIIGLFEAACERYEVDPTEVADNPGRGDTKASVADVLNPEWDDTQPLTSVGDAVLRFYRHADDPDGKTKEAVSGYAIYHTLNRSGEFFTTSSGRFFYFDGTVREVIPVDGDGRKTLSDEFRATVWDRFNLDACGFSRDLGANLKARAKKAAPQRRVYRFAHYNATAEELYVNDFGSGYYVITPDGIDRRPNGTDVFFLDLDAEAFQYVPPEDRDGLPDDLPGELTMWGDEGDDLMRIFGNRINFDEGATLAPMEQRRQLYLHLHTLPFIDITSSRPIMAWVGEKGSGKTVIQRSIGRFIYGPDFAESLMPDDRRDFMAKVVNQPLAFIDNYDDGVNWANDILAGVATGSGVDLREYFTTLGLSQYTPRCWLSLTSRDPPFRRDDVADRTLVFRVERVRDTDFVGMGTYLRQVEEHRDELWSTYLDNLQAVLAEYAGRDIDAMSSGHRMADWAILATVVGDALDVPDIDGLLDTMQTERATFALENEAWARVLDRWITEEPAIAREPNSASDIADRLEATANGNDLQLDVSSAQGIGSKFATYRDELGELYGLAVDESGKTNAYRFATDVAGGIDTYAE